MIPMTWLLVFAGEADWTRVVAAVLGQIEVAAADAHTLTFCEQSGERWSLLLVHYSSEECWAVERGSSSIGRTASSTASKTSTQVGNELARSLLNLHCKNSG